MLFTLLFLLQLGIADSGKTEPAVAPTSVMVSVRAATQLRQLSEQIQHTNKEAAYFLGSRDLGDHWYTTDGKITSGIVSDNENLACMVGTVDQAGLAHIDSIVPQEPERSGPNWIIPKDACKTVKGTLGIVHSHPTQERCWYYFPGTAVETSDGNAANKSEFLIDGIACGPALVWINKKGLQQITSL